MEVPYTLHIAALIIINKLQHQPFSVEPLVKSCLLAPVLDEPLGECRAVNGFADAVDKCFCQSFADESLIESLDGVVDFVGEGDELDCFFEDVDQEFRLLCGGGIRVVKLALAECVRDEHGLDGEQKFVVDGGIAVGLLDFGRVHLDFFVFHENE